MVDMKAKPSTNTLEIAQCVSGERNGFEVVLTQRWMLFAIILTAHRMLAVDLNPDSAVVIRQWQCVLGWFRPLNPEIVDAGVR
ncbi:hypothetical protein AJ80_07545 [Polytolypa hystricis UAMH7299]|uniref:Uncharacterized protein n=1 Tax=Polytolypa hystricis (strain UAMH7299) TaxID=1447883 RepID=A0A2B7XM12_POLH7|nr:hypothetical protein AJ80_07545 [Polytolypa hystricis UAMH7299]